MKNRVSWNDEFRGHSQSSRLGGEAGFSLVGQMIIVGLVTTVLFIVTHMMLTAQSKLSIEQYRFALENTRENIVNGMLHPEAWNYTINHPLNASALSCLVIAGTYCTEDGSPTGTPIQNRTVPVLVGADGKAIFDNSQPNTGFQLYGAHESASNAGDDPFWIDSMRCTYQTGDPTTLLACPFTMEITWSAICQNNCDKPQAELQVRFNMSNEYITATRARYNLDAMTIKIAPGTLQPGVL